MSYSNCSEQDLSLFGYYIGFLYAQQPCLDQFSQHSASTALPVWYTFFFFFLMDTISSLTGVGLSEGYSLGWMFWLKICQFDTCLIHLTVCSCVHCQSLCVLRVYVCVYMSVNCIVYFSSMIWPLIVLRKRKHTGSLSIFFHISFFLMSLCHFQTD